MIKQDLTYSITVDQTPKEAFAAIINVRGWWSGEITGRTDLLGAEWTYRYQDLHRTTQKITELEPGKRIVWLVTDSSINFVKDRQEWNNTRIVFDIARKGKKTEVRFVHEGLVPKIECYGDCAEAWGFYIKESLFGLISTGKGHPNPAELASL